MTRAISTINPNEGRNLEKSSFLCFKNEFREKKLFEREL